MAAQAKPISELSVLIVGGTSGIGLATAAALLRAGAPRLRLVGRNPDKAAARDWTCSGCVCIRGAANGGRGIEFRIMDGVDPVTGATCRRLHGPRRGPPR